MKLKYNNIEWSIPTLINNSEFNAILSEWILKFGDIKNPIKSLYGKIFDPMDICAKKIADTISQNFISSNYSLQLSTEGYSNPEIFYNEFFSDIMRNFNDKHYEIICNDDFTYNYIKNKFYNIKIIASSLNLVQDFSEKKPVAYYEDILQKFDRVILDPKYVKQSFLNDYKKYSNVSKFEVYANYSDELALTADEIKKLSEEIGITHFRLSGTDCTVGTLIEYLFGYIFIPDAYSIYTLTEYLDSVVYSKRID